MVPKIDLIINTEETVAKFLHSNQCRLPNKPRVIFNNTVIVYDPGEVLRYLHYRKLKMGYPYSFIMFKFEQGTLYH
jgi:hypothetical protein